MFAQLFVLNIISWDLIKVPPKNVKSATNGDDDDHKTPDLFDDVYGACC